MMEGWLKSRFSTSNHCATKLAVGLWLCPHSSSAGDTPVAELAPHQITEAVSVIEEAFLEDFLVQTGAVEACGHGQFDVLDQRCVVR